MTLPATALAGVINPFWLGWLDIAGDVVRVSTLPYDFTPTGTGDADLDGHEFISLPAALVAVSPVVHAETGSDQVTAELSGIDGADTTLLTALADPATWRGRTARLWRGLADDSFVPAIIEGYYTGYMMSLDFTGDPTSQTITITIENYLALLTAPRRRTYQDQKEHDPTDESAARIRASANGIQTAAGFGGGGGGGVTVSGAIGRAIVDQR